MTLFLETKRLLITKPDLFDFDHLMNLQSDADVMRYIGTGVVRQPDQVMLGLEKAIAHQEKHGFSLGCVFDKDTGEFVGRAGLIHLAYDDQQPDIEVGYALVKSAWRKGFATELARALVQWGFAHLPVDKLVAVINPNNERSRKVLERIGMHYKGRRQYWQQDVAFYELMKPAVDPSLVKLVPATLADYPVIQNMARFYVYDMSEFMGSEPGWECPANGLFECIDFKKYWQTTESYPLLIYYANELAGFAIVDKKGSEATTDFNMAQFFILRKFKNKGIGRIAATACFQQFPGSWEVMILPGNEGAYRFWRKIIHAYADDVSEYTRAVSHLEGREKNIFKFTTTKNNAN